MLQQRIATNERPRKAFRLSLARHQDEVREAQRRRWKIFSEEMGARLNSPEAGYDMDVYVPFCEHLLACGRGKTSVLHRMARRFMK
jgi:putative hemolysin